MKRTRAYRRRQRQRIIARKADILWHLGGENEIMAWTKGQKGRLAKGKIHCSCWMCRQKSYDYPLHSDELKLLAARQQTETLVFCGQD
jgi:hypothetical protein